MSCGVEDVAEIKVLCPQAAYLTEGGCGFISLPSLKFPVERSVVERDALLSLSAHSGYTSRLYLSAIVPGKGRNWTIHNVFGRAWHTPSWQGVQPGRPVEMLGQHLEAYR